MILQLDMIQTIALASVLLFLGQRLKNSVELLDRFCIPAPVIGGLIFAIFTLFLRQNGILEFEMDTTLQDFLMTTFFTTVGFTASFKMLKRGGLKVLVFTVLASVLVIMQNVIGIGLSNVFHLDHLLGLSTGSASMTGGHGTSLAFAPLFEQAGATGATTVAMAAATFGLITGSMLGGPVAKRLIEKNGLLVKEDSSQKPLQETVKIVEETKLRQLIPENFTTATSQIILAMGIGTIVSMLFQGTGMTFPSYIGAMLAAAIMRNVSDITNSYQIQSDEIDIMGSISLSLFLSMALMGLKLWQLVDLAGPMVAMLASQALLMGSFAYFITFNLMGRDYEAAVLAGGHCGFGMGATPNAIANMEAITGKYGPAPSAFLIIPLVGSMFIDFFNAGTITVFMNLF